MPLTHPFAPVFDRSSRILILGTFPSVKSRENHFYYGHPQNRFWRLISAIVEKPVPSSNDEKRALLIENYIALWDVLQSCEIEGSADATIKNPVANDLGCILNGSGVKRIFFNGNAARELYCKYGAQLYEIETDTLPSSSPANAQYTFDRLYQVWKQKLSL